MKSKGYYGLIIVFLFLISVQGVQADGYNLVDQWAIIPTYSPTGIAVDGTGGYVYVTEYSVSLYDSYIEKFDTAGNPIDNFHPAAMNEYSGEIALHPDGNSIYLHDPLDGDLMRIDSTTGSILDESSGWYPGGVPYGVEGIAVSSSNNRVYISGSDDQIHIWDYQLDAEVGSWGTTGSGESQFDNPRGIAIDSSGNVYVADYNNNRVQIFEDDGTFIDAFDTGDKPVGIDVDSSGRIYLTYDMPYNSWFDLVAGLDHPDYPLGWLLQHTLYSNSPNSEPWIEVDSAGYAYITDFSSSQVLKYEYPTTGGVILSSNPDGAEIWIDGADTGEVTQDPYGTTIIGLSPGEHPVTFKYPGYYDYEFTTTVMEGWTIAFPIYVMEKINQKIVFSSDRSGNFEIYEMVADGSSLMQLTNDPGSDDVPAWSPDGTKIAFTSERAGPGNTEIYVMDPDGSNVIRLTDSPGEDFDPAWSPDGTKIAFISTRDGGYEVYLMNPDGSSQQRLTNNPAGGFAWPTWSPDGTKIAFHTIRDGNWEVYVMDADGTNQINLTNDPGTDGGPAWSPDGTKIAFTSERAGPGNTEIYIMEPDGSNVIRLTDSPGEDFEPAWSPDGTKIAFISTRDGNYEVYVMDQYGSSQQRITNDPAVDQEPVWSRSALDLPVQTAVQVVIDDELAGDTTGVTVSAYPHTVPAQPTIEGWDGSYQFMDTDEECSLISVDHAPEANWEHPVTYYAVEADGDWEKYDTTTPVTNYDFVYSRGETSSPGENWQPDDPYVWTPACTNDCSNNYAVLISGGNDANHNYRRYWNDIAFMYINLREYGYDPAHITVLMSDGGGAGADRCIAGYPTCTQKDDSPRNLDGIGTGDAGNETVLDAGKTTILNKLESMRPAASGGTSPLPAGANLLVFTTAHGGVIPAGQTNAGHQYIYAWGGTGSGQYITDTELIGKLNQLTQLNSITLIMENCNSGGFKEEFIAGLPNQKRKILYAAAGDEPSWGNGFSNALTTGYAGHTRWYTSSCTSSSCSADYDKGADIDKNERVTANEAMAYARLKDPYYTSSTTPVAGKERSNIQVNSAAAADATSQYLSPCTGTASASITVKDPAANVNWLKGTQHLITWDAKGLANRKVSITLLKSGATQKVIVPSTAGVSASNPMKYCWNIPTDTSVPTSTTNVYSVRIQTADSLASVTGTSKTFKIGAAPTTNQGSLKITVTEKGAATTTYLAPAYTVTNPCLGTIVASGRVAASSKGTTTPVLSPQGNYLVGLVLQGYYPVNNAPVTVAAGTVNVPLTMEKIPTDPNDVPPFGGIDVSSSPDGASIWIGRTGSPLTDSGYKTDYPEYYLAPGEYQVQVKKDGYMDSDIRTVTVESMTSDRVPVTMYFELTPLVQPYTIGGFSAPVTMNGVVNTAKAGQTVPIKWHLVDKNGVVSNPASFMGLYSYEVKCDDNSPVSAELKESAAGNSGLKYLGNGNWQFNWKTPKSYAGKCREMFVRFNDNQELHALFKFK